MPGDDSEPVDVLPKLTEGCKPQCTEQWAKYEACIVRLEKKKEGDCEPWYFDHLKCLDKCRGPQLFKHLK
eukprot:gene4588-4917_t